MVEARDVAWSIAVCVLLMVFVQCRAAHSAEALVEHDAQQGFRQAYDGSRFITGEIITQGNGGFVDPLKPTIEARRFELVAERQSITGGSVELIARHVIKIADGTPGGTDASQEAHVKLERKDGRWAYAFFETRDGQVLDSPDAGNPWARTLLARAAAPPRDRFGGGDPSSGN